VACELDGKMSRKSSAALVRSFKSKIA
jgi:hypothetical protein